MANRGDCSIHSIVAGTRSQNEAIQMYILGAKYLSLLRLGRVVVDIAGFEQ